MIDNMLEKMVGLIGENHEKEDPLYLDLEKRGSNRSMMTIYDKDKYNNLQKREFVKLSVDSPVAKLATYLKQEATILAEKGYKIRVFVNESA